MIIICFPISFIFSLVSQLFVSQFCSCWVASVMWLTLCDPVDYSLPGSSVHRIFQARILEWVVMPVSKGSSWPRDQIPLSCVSCIAGGFFTSEPPGSPCLTFRDTELVEALPTQGCEKVGCSSWTTSLDTKGISGDVEFLVVWDKKFSDLCKYGPTSMWFWFVTLKQVFIFPDSSVSKESACNAGDPS